VTTRSGRIDKAQRLLVVAAHPDDDVIGCGGTMALVARSGSVTALYVSDGSRSHPASREYPPERIAAVRELEALAALKALGVREPPVFLRYPDGELATLTPARRNVAVRSIAEAIDRLRPDAVLAPWLRDPHPDHGAAAALALDAVARAGFEGNVGFYEVWLRVRGEPGDRPHVGEVHATWVSLDAEARERKGRALAAHRSQTGDLIKDDTGGFRITAELTRVWLGPRERLLWRVRGERDRSNRLPAGKLARGVFAG
jgi:LmbE family N-acetylglucosaminyl deacetylase